MENEKTGARLRDEGTAAALAADAAAHRGYRNAIEWALEALIASGEVFTADDVRDRLPKDVRKHMSPALLPAVLRIASTRGRVECVGWAISRRRERHCGPVRQWRAVASQFALPMAA